MTIKYGWVKIYRSLQEHWIWNNDEKFDKRAAWIDLILLANYEDCKMMMGSTLKTIHPGQLHTSLKKLADRWHWNRETVLHFLEALEQDRMIYTQRNKHGTTITIGKYGVYQDLQNDKPTDDQTDNPTDNPTSFRPMTRHNVRSTTYKNIKEQEEEKNKGRQAAGDFSKNKPPKIGDIRFKQFDQYGNEWWEKCENIRTDGHVYWKGYWRWELEELQQRKGGVMPWDVGKKKE